MIPGIDVEIAKKPVKCLRIAVYPGTGRVRVSAPLRATDAAIWDFVTSKTDWIRKHLSKAAERAPEVPLEYVSGETHPLFGEPYRLEIEESAKPRALLRGNSIVLAVPRGSDKAFRKALLDELYRLELKKVLPVMMANREAQMGVRAAEWRVRAMKTKWGTCNVRDKRLWLSLELAKKPLRAVEYVVVHELAHLIERGHGPKFKAVMDRFYPGWREVKGEMVGRGG